MFIVKSAYNKQKLRAKIVTANRHNYTLGKIQNGQIYNPVALAVCFIVLGKIAQNQIKKYSPVDYMILALCNLLSVAK